MTQFPKRTHRAREHMEALGRRIPDIWSLIDQVRVANADDIGGPDWPTYCYLPLEHAGMIAAQLMRMDGTQPTPSLAARHGSIFAALSAWRMTQGIYRFDAALYPALIDTPLDGDLPASIIQHLPEWCVYIETPDMTVRTSAGETPLRGAFVWLDRARGQHHDILTMLLDADGTDLSVTHVPLVGTMRDAIASTVAEWRSAYQRGNSPTMPPAEYEAEALRTLTPLVSLVLYLCTEAADITGKHGAPGNPQPIRTRRNGMRLFAADGMRTWDVGVRLGAALRRAYQQAEIGAADESGRTVRPHVRRAHWHTFVAGPRNDVSRQERRLKWLPPIAVNLDDAGDLPAVIRRVE